MTVGSDKSREHFVSRENAIRILEACPNAEWRLIFSLWRFGGLRCPSEVLDLRWVEFVWDQNRIVLTSRKTTHHEGYGPRVIPIFPELWEPLQEVFEQSEVGSVHVITRYRCQNSNLRTQFNRIVRRAGLKSWLKSWLKSFQNMRSTR